MKNIVFDKYMYFTFQFVKYYKKKKIKEWPSKVGLLVKKKR